MNKHFALTFLVVVSAFICVISALEFKDCGNICLSLSQIGYANAIRQYSSVQLDPDFRRSLYMVGHFTKIEVSDCVTSSSACILKRDTNATIAIDFEISIDQSTKVTAIVHGVLMGMEMPFPLQNPDGCIASGITCPIEKGTSYEYVATLPVLKSYPKVKVDVKWELVDGNKEVIVCVLIPAKIQ